MTSTISRVELFDQEIADDEKTLTALGLAGPSPTRDYQPGALPAADVAQIEQVITALLPADKNAFNEGGTTEQVASELAAAVDRMEGPPEAVQNVRRTLERFHDRSDLPGA